MIQQTRFHQKTRRAQVLSITLFSSFLLLSSFVAPAQKIKTDRKLQKQLNQLIDHFDGVAGVYVYHLKNHKEVAIRADTIFPTASIIKVPILAGVFDKIEQKELSYHQKMIYRDSMQSGGSGLMQFFKDSTQTELSILLSLMLSYSDNTAAIWCQSLAGGGKTINPLMESLGLHQTRVNSRTLGREKDWEKYGWGQTTPREMATLLLKIREGKVVNQAASDRMYRLMTNIYYDEYALSQIPPYVQTASKQGMVNASRSELVMVNAPHGDYVFYIATKNNKDQRWAPDNEAWELARKVSSTIWNYYEPRSKWGPSSL